MARLRARGGLALFLLAPAAALVGGVGLAACSASSKLPGSSTTVASPSVPTTTVASVKVAGTEETGSLSFMGSVSRLAVTAVPDGLESEPPALPGTPAYRKTVQIGYRQLGSGKPLVLIQGEAATMDWWSPGLLSELAGHYRVTLFDLPGTGYSGPASSPVTVDSLADLTAGLISELRIDSPVVLGWGLGGQVALALAERHPGVMGDLVLADTGVPTKGSRPLQKPAAALLSSGPPSPLRLAPLLFTASERAAEQSWLSSLEREIPDPMTAAAVAAQSQLEANFWHHTDLVRGLRSIDQPTLVVDGTADRVFPPTDAAALAGSIKGAQRYSWNGAGYGALLAEGPHFAQLLEGFTG